MLNFATEGIQEIKNLKFFNENHCVVANIDNLSNLLLDGYPNKFYKATYANLQGEYKGLNFTSNYQANKAYRIEGDIVIKNLIDNNIYEDKFVASNAKINIFNVSNIIISLYQFDNKLPYDIVAKDNYISEYEVKSSMLMYTKGIEETESAKLIINDTIDELIDGLVKNPKLETVEVIKELILLSQKY